MTPRGFVTWIIRVIDAVDFFRVIDETALSRPTPPVASESISRFGRPSQCVCVGVGVIVVATIVTRMLCRRDSEGLGAESRFPTSLRWFGRDCPLHWKSESFTLDFRVLYIGNPSPLHWISESFTLETSESFT